MQNLDLLNISSLRSRQGEKWSHYGDDIIPAWVADMDFEIAAPIRDAIIERLDRFDCGYPVSPRNTGLAEIFVDRAQRRYAWEINPSQVDLFNDVVQAIYFGLLTLSDEGAGVVIHTPIYPPFLGAAEETKRRIIDCPLVLGTERFEIDFDQMNAAIDDGTQILLFCNPHNPSGRRFSREELDKLGELVLKHGLYVISDEIHADLVLDNKPHIPIASIDPAIAERTVTLMSASKAFNIAGICMAFAVFGSDALRKRFDAVPRHLRGGVSALSIAAVGAALSRGDEWLEHVRLKLRSNRDLLARHATTRWAGMSHFPPEATYLAWFDCRALGLEPDPYRYFLEHARVALSDGSRFGAPGLGFVRLNFATSEPILQEILARIDKALESRNGS